MRAPFSTTAPIPIRASSSTVQPWTHARWPTRHAGAQRAREPGVGVQHRPVLDVGLVADRDVLGVAADHRPRPHRARGLRARHAPMTSAASWTKAPGPSCGRVAGEGPDHVSGQGSAAHRGVGAMTLTDAVPRCFSRSSPHMIPRSDDPIRGCDRAQAQGGPFAGVRVVAALGLLSGCVDQQRGGRADPHQLPDGREQRRPDRLRGQDDHGPGGGRRPAAPAAAAPRPSGGGGGEAAGDVEAGLAVVPGQLHRLPPRRRPGGRRRRPEARRPRPDRGRDRDPDRQRQAARCPAAW